MDTVKKININDMPRWFRAILALFPLLFLIKINAVLDNDFYFLYPTGEYIVNNGFPTHDILSMHSGMDIIVQQWLATVIFYFTYSTFGKMGMYLLTMATYLIFVLVIFRLCKMISGNHFISCVATTAAGFFASMYEVTRPQIFTYIILAAEVYFLEKYVRTGKIGHLIALPILSVLLVNTHSSMWVMILVLMLPYLVGGVKFRIFKLSNNPSYKLLPVIAAFVISTAAGFANPYGLKAMKYITSSFGYDEISNGIIEMQPVELMNATGALLIICIVIVGIVLLKSGTEFNCRFVLLYGGLAVFSLMSYKSVPYFFIGAAPTFAYYMKDKSFSLSMKKSSNKSKIILSVALVAAIAFLGFAAFNAQDSSVKLKDREAISTYSQMDRIVSILDKVEGDVVLYAGFNNGQYLEFKGYHPYIDGRAELFLKDNNHEYNYMREYYRLHKAQIYYKEFLDRYSFNYLVVSIDEAYLYNSLMHDDDYEILYDGAAVRKEYEKKHNIKNSKKNNEISDIALFVLKDKQ